jgi:hypothetical protein
MVAPFDLAISMPARVSAVSLTVLRQVSVWVVKIFNISKKTTIRKAIVLKSVPIGLAIVLPAFFPRTVRLPELLFKTSELRRQPVAAFFVWREGNNSDNAFPLRIRKRFVIVLAFSFNKINYRNSIIATFFAAIIVGFDFFKDDTAEITTKSKKWHNLHWFIPSKNIISVFKLQINYYLISQYLFCIFVNTLILQY